MRLKSYFQIICPCGRTVTTEETKIVCQCGRLLLISWPAPAKQETPQVTRIDARRNAA